MKNFLMNKKIEDSMEQFYKSKQDLLEKFKNQEIVPNKKESNILNNSLNELLIKQKEALKFSAVQYDKDNKYGDFLPNFDNQFSYKTSKEAKLRDTLSEFFNTTRHSIEAATIIDMIKSYADKFND